MFETIYPYIRLFYAVNELEYYWQFLEEEDFFLMDQSIINFITIKKDKTVTYDLGLFSDSHRFYIEY